MRDWVTGGRKSRTRDWAGSKGSPFCFSHEQTCTVKGCTVPVQSTPLTVHSPARRCEKNLDFRLLVWSRKCLKSSNRIFACHIHGRHKKWQLRFTYTVLICVFLSNFCSWRRPRGKQASFTGSKSDTATHVTCGPGEMGKGPSWGQRAYRCRAGTPD